jgi:hypothetical protein
MQAANEQSGSLVLAGTTDLIETGTSIDNGVDTVLRMPEQRTRE